MASALVALPLVTAVSSAQEPAGATAPAPQPATATAEPAAPAEAGSEEIRRDPKGVKGISPMYEAVNRGDAAFIAKDFAAALTEYTNAIKADPKNPVGHLRMAQLHLDQQRHTEAQESIVSALRFVGNRLVYKAQAFFLLAMLREAQKSADDATDSWSAYEALKTETTTAAGNGVTVYAGTAQERAAMLAKHKKLTVDYAPVKERIQKRLAEAEASVKKSQKK